MAQEKREGTGAERPLGKAWEEDSGLRDMYQGRISDGQEVLEALTRILRGEGGAKPGEVLRAAELLGKRYSLFAEREPQEGLPIIVEDLPEEEG